MADEKKLDSPPKPAIAFFESKVSPSKAPEMYSVPGGKVFVDNEDCKVQTVNPEKSKLKKKMTDLKKNGSVSKNSTITMVKYKSLIEESEEVLSNAQSKSGVYLYAIPGSVWACENALRKLEMERAATSDALKIEEFQDIEKQLTCLVSEFRKLMAVHNCDLRQKLLYKLNLLNSNDAENMESSEIKKQESLSSKDSNAYNEAARALEPGFEARERALRHMLRYGK